MPNDELIIARAKLQQNGFVQQALPNSLAECFKEADITEEEHNNMSRSKIKQFDYKFVKGKFEIYLITLERSQYQTSDQFMEWVYYTTPLNHRYRISDRHSAYAAFNYQTTSDEQVLYNYFINEKWICKHHDGGICISGWDEFLRPDRQVRLIIKSPQIDYHQKLYCDCNLEYRDEHNKWKVHCQGLRTLPLIKESLNKIVIPEKLTGMPIPHHFTPSSIIQDKWDWHNLMYKFKFKSNDKISLLSLLKIVKTDGFKIDHQLAKPDENEVWFHCNITIHSYFQDKNNDVQIITNGEVYLYTKGKTNLIVVSENKFELTTNISYPINYYIQ